MINFEFLLVLVVGLMNLSGEFLRLGVRRVLVGIRCSPRTPATGTLCLHGCART